MKATSPCHGDVWDKDGEVSAPIQFRFVQIKKKDLHINLVFVGK